MVDLRDISNLLQGRTKKNDVPIGHVNLADFLKGLCPSQYVDLQIIDRGSFRGVIEYPIKSHSKGITAAEATQKLDGRTDMHLGYVWGRHVSYSGRGNSAHYLWIRTGSVDCPWSEFSIECTFPN